MKKLALIGASAVGLLGAAVCGATPIITLPESFMASIITNVGQLFTDLSTVILVVAAIPLGFYVIRRVIGLVRAV